MPTPNETEPTGQGRRFQVAVEHNGWNWSSNGPYRPLVFTIAELAEAHAYEWRCTIPPTNACVIAGPPFVLPASEPQEAERTVTFSPSPLHQSLGLAGTWAIRPNEPPSPPPAAAPSEGERAIRADERKACAKIVKDRANLLDSCYNVEAYNELIWAACDISGESKPLFPDRTREAERSSELARLRAENAGLREEIEKLRSRIRW